ncbi:MAG: TetR/AcrR family transcriptional regulator [Lachnospiraceae bacterium]|nr:TetR/AcrR family transcriptional regulator [Lachnospiraceae bacterium]
MNDKFFDLRKEKQNRMINAALKNFAEKGYKHASTDDMVRDAGISKGLLFHYFGSKVGLYTFVYEYSARYMLLELDTQLGGVSHEFFEHIKLVERARLNAMREYPYMLKFLDTARGEDVKEALLAVEDRRNQYAEACEALKDSADTDRIPEDVDYIKLWNMMEFTIKGLMQERFLDASFQADMLYDEVAEYIDLMSRLVYK